MSSLVCRALCKVMSFLVLLSICLSSSFVHFQNGLELLTRGSAQLFNPFLRFLWYSLASSNFDVLLRYSFKFFFFHIYLYDLSASSIPKYFYVSFSLSIRMFSCFVSSISLVTFLYRFSLLAWHIFLCQIKSLCPDCIFSLPVLVLNSFSFSVWCRPCTLGD